MFIGSLYLIVNVLSGLSGMDLYLQPTAEHRQVQPATSVNYTLSERELQPTTLTQDLQPTIESEDLGK